jgi:D-ribose pyranase
MKKAVLLNAPISRVIALMGHGDMLCVADAGLPVPDAVERIDLAVCAGLPPFTDTLSAITTEIYVERAVVAAELRDTQPRLYQRLMGEIADLGRAQANNIAVDHVSHERFKKMTQDCKAVVRTGEITPYANVILYAGVTFGGHANDELDGKTAKAQS